MADSKQIANSDNTLDPWDVALFGGAAASMYRSVPPTPTEAPESPAPVVQKTEEVVAPRISNAGIPKDFTEAHYDVQTPVAPSVQIPINTIQAPIEKKQEIIVEQTVPNVTAIPILKPEPKENPPQKVQTVNTPPVKEKIELPKAPEGLLVSPYPVAVTPKSITQKVPTALLALAVAVPIFVLGFYAADYAKRAFMAQQNSDLPSPMTANIENLLPSMAR